MERVENSARLMDVYSSMLFDMPRGSRFGWDILLDITGLRESYEEKNSTLTETAVIRFLLADANNMSAAGWL